MSRLVRVFFAVVFISLGLAFVLGPLSTWFSDTTTTISLSPNEAYWIRLVERKPNLPIRIDRNFKIILETRANSQEELIFDSPDEGTPIGTERFIWSKDSDYVLLVGKHFFTEPPHIRISDDGSEAYFLYHVPTRRKWYNTKQTHTLAPALTKELLRGIKFEQSVQFDDDPQ